MNHNHALYMYMPMADVSMSVMLQGPAKADRQPRYVESVRTSCNHDAGLSLASSL